MGTSLHSRRCSNRVCPPGIPGTAAAEVDPDHDPVRGKVRPVPHVTIGRLRKEDGRSLTFPEDELPGGVPGIRFGGAVRRGRAGNDVLMVGEVDDRLAGKPDRDLEDMIEGGNVGPDEHDAQEPDHSGRRDLI